MTSSSASVSSSIQMYLPGLKWACWAGMGTRNLSSALSPALPAWGVRNVLCWLPALQLNAKPNGASSPPSLSKMDPNATLKLIRQRVRAILNSNGAASDEAYFLAEDFDNLDQWLLAGGFKPTDWQ
jgi:hypothetical protein